MIPTVFAAEPWRSLGGPGPKADVATIASLESLFKNVATAAGSLAIVALFIMLIVGGFKFLFSGGDAKKMEAAKGTVTASVLGIVLVATAYLIIRLIGEFAGVPDITTFQIQTSPIQ